MGALHDGKTDSATREAAIRIATAINRRSFLHRTFVVSAGAVGWMLGLPRAVWATHNYTVRTGCPSGYSPDGCGDNFGCGPSNRCLSKCCDGTHCLGGVSGCNGAITSCAGFNCWTWSVCCNQPCGSGQVACYRWTCCDCDCPDGQSYCQNTGRCICGVRQLTHCAQ